MAMDLTSRRRFLTLLAASIAASACGSGPGVDGSAQPPTTIPDRTDAGGIETITNSYDRATPSGSGIDGVRGDRQLTAQLFAMLGQDTSSNFIFSPYSIATAFSMLLAGAGGTTAEQLAAALGSTDQDWHDERNALDVAVRTPPSEIEGAEPLELDIANTPYGQVGFDFEDQFIQTLAEQYGAQLRALDFAADPDAARELINADVAEDTQDRITDLLPPGSIDALTRLVLVNTVFFKATWFNEFNPASTIDRPFNRLDNTAVQASTMRGSVRTTYAAQGDWQMVRLPYFGGYSMTIVVPDGGAFDAVAARFDANFIAELGDIRSDFAVDLHLPKFDFKSEADLVPLFQAMGVTDAFDRSRADLTGIQSDGDLYVSGAYHQATIEVDEVGTTATAATALIVSATSAPEPVELSIDRPFIFLITQDDIGAPLFAGQVTDPTA